MTEIGTAKDSSSLEASVTCPVCGRPWPNKKSLAGHLGYCRKKNASILKRKARHRKAVAKRKARLKAMSSAERADEEKFKQETKPHFCQDCGMLRMFCRCGRRVIEEFG